MPDPRRSGLPPLALGGLYALLAAAPVLIALATGQAHRWPLMRAAAASGMAAGVMLHLQMITSGRFEAISGRIGIDVTMAFHKWAAPVALALAALHVAFLVGPPDAAHPHRFDQRLWTLIKRDDLQDARWALGLMALLVLLALFRDRLRLRYELWRASHLALALILLAVFLGHLLTDGRFGTLSLGFWLLLIAAVLLPALGVYARRLLHPLSRDWTLASARKVAPRLWEVTLAPPPDCTFTYRPGQFAWLVFGRHRLPLFDHPFSIASSPDEPNLRFLIQEVGDFTRTLGSLEPGTRVGLDAPHGSFGLDSAIDPVVLVAGGVGIAPVLSVLGGLAASGHKAPVRLAYAGHDASGMVGPDFWRPACERLGIEPLLLASHGHEEAGMQKGPLKPPHMETLMQGLDPKKTQVLICGPGPMMTAACNGFQRLGVPLGRIQYERFSYSAGAMSAKDRRMLWGFLATWAGVGAVILAYSLL
ncbi:MAG: ferric reductase-like transmembrane domain-containing protein [Rhodobacteraceae bacterium]|nr:ferric reductase-like transmembrane domain-containing protein [Paracoccaceae bacterium]